LVNIMRGYCLPGVFFSERLKVLVSTLFHVCADKTVPLLELRGLSSLLVKNLMSSFYMYLIQLRFFFPF
jgi:hypothetical protein